MKLLAILPFMLYSSNAQYNGGRRGVNPKVYKLDERPTPMRVEFPKPNGQCTVSPWLLWMMLNRGSLSDGGSDGGPDNSFPVLQQYYTSDFVYGPGGSDENPGKAQNTVLQLLSNCRDNKEFRGIMSIDYIMNDKPSLASDAGISEFGGLPNNPVYQFLGLQPGETLSDWGDSKVFMNLYKWRVYNELMRGQLFGIKRFQQQFDLYKEVRDEAKIEHAGDDDQSMLEMVDWVPFFNNLNFFENVK